MKKILLTLFIFILGISLVGCSQRTFETPPLEEFEVSNPQCQNLIIFIGDGMSDNHIEAGEIVYDKTYSFTSWDKTYSDTYSWDTFAGFEAVITDSAAGGTAIATGVTTINGYVGMDHDPDEPKELPTILDYAKEMGKSVGIVTTDEITGATPSDFSAHVLSRSFTDMIIDSQITSNVDLFIGQYSATVNARKNDIEKGGYTYYTSSKELDKINKQKKVWCQFDFEESGGKDTLSSATQIAVEYLSQNENGYVLMVEGAHIDKQSHNRNFGGMVMAMNNLNNAIEYASEIAKTTSTGIIITADHETGLLEVSSENVYQHKYGKAYYNYRSDSHSGTNVPVYVFGFTVDFSEFNTLETFDNCIKNKDIFKVALYAITGQK